MQLSGIGYNNVWGTSSTSSASYAAKTQLSSSTQIGTSADEDSLTLSDDYYKLQSFLEKVKDGTATDEDMEQMQQTLNQGGMQMPPPPPPMTNPIDGVTQSSSSSDGTSVSSIEEDMQSISDFLEKVKSGTATDDDLTQAQSVLTRMSESTQSEGSSGTQRAGIMPPPPPGGMAPPPQATDESDSTSDSSDLIDQLLEFLEKVKEGTATQDDVDSMSGMLKQNETESTSSESENETSIDDLTRILTSMQNRNSWIAQYTSEDSDSI